MDTKIKILLHHYDLFRLRDSVNAMGEAMCFFKYKPQIVLDANFRFAASDDLEKIKENKQKYAEGIRANLKYLPLFSFGGVSLVTLFEQSDQIEFTRRVLECQKQLGTEFFVLPTFDVGSTFKKETHKTLAKTFLSETRKKYPNSKVGIYLRVDSQEYAKELIAGYDFVIVSAHLSKWERIVSLDRIIDAAKESGVSVYCNDAHLVVENLPFAPELIRAPVAGFSQLHGEPPHTKTQKSYYFPGEFDGKRGQYLTKGQLLSKFPGYTPLTVFCDCDLCAEYTLNSLFDLSHRQLVDFNIAHKAKFLYIAAEKSWQAFQSEQPALEKKFLHELSVPAISSPTSVGNYFVKPDSEITVPAGNLKDRVLSVIKQAPQGITITGIWNLLIPVEQSLEKNMLVESVLELVAIGKVRHFVHQDGLTYLR